eukprot:TRINITY_DN36405_c0_g1_i1.p1 TRINITY_DN36405_c0_g1~~TRINITY_DN36405_c0_g1_i1.p1  ORF type:complete len:142 (+),score=8.00 TRINITY_DN36405_c0_g1_i1:203-628(+)
MGRRKFANGCHDLPDIYSSMPDELFMDFGSGAPSICHTCDEARTQKHRPLGWCLAGKQLDFARCEGLWCDLDNLQYHLEDTTGQVLGIADAPPRPLPLQNPTHSAGAGLVVVLFQGQRAGGGMGFCCFSLRLCLAARLSLS